MRVIMRASDEMLSIKFFHRCCGLGVGVTWQEEPQEHLGRPGAGAMGARSPLLASALSSYGTQAVCAGLFSAVNAG